MNVQLLRNATQVITVNGKTLLVDPMLASQGSYEPFNNTGNTLKNPLVDLPINHTGLKKLIGQTDAVLLTHLHLDHWDTAAQQLIPKHTPIICQPANTETLKQAGFLTLLPVDESLLWHGIRINRTGGQHGTGEIGKRMGIVSGFVITHQQSTLYIAGDTIWCDEVKEAIYNHKPAMIIVNGGGARFTSGNAIVMDIEDMLTVCRYAPDAKVYVVHLEAVNHGKETRADIRAAIKESGLDKQCLVPEDGEWFIG
ncbi:MBL fold metallo-hydrolase [Mucilaginibacter sp. AW1-3]